MFLSVPHSWQHCLNDVIESDRFKALSSFLEKEYATKLIQPKRTEIFNAYLSTAPNDVKVVIIGQDPYPTAGHAHGLSFSVQQDVRPFPKSLKNIFKEIQDDCGIANPKHGNLQHWANQGVFLLNTILTVETGLPLSHKQKGWETFTDATITAINTNRSNVVFLLWGAKAIAKKQLIDTSKHYVLESVHPSPLSAYRGFFGCKHFSKTNDYLEQQGNQPIDWELQ